MTQRITLSPTEREALNRLIPPDRQTDDVVADLTAAAREAWQRREQNTVDGGAVLAALHRDAGSWRTVGYVTGIPASTAHRWATPPSVADNDRPEPDDQGEPVTATTPVERPIVAAVVTSPLGMLVTWRNDKTPPAGFLTGEIEPGESAADAMVRECKEEARLRVVPGNVVGDRVHPRTGRRMIYVSGTVADVRDAAVSVGDAEELAAVRWVSLAEADAAFAAFGGMFGPVHEHLQKALGT